MQGAIQRFSPITIVSWFRASVCSEPFGARASRISWLDRNRFLFYYSKGRRSCFSGHDLSKSRSGRLNADQAFGTARKLKVRASRR